MEKDKFLILRSPLGYTNTEKHHEVPMGSMARTHEETLVTGGVAPCIVVAAWNSETSFGLLGHLHSLSTEGLGGDEQRALLGETVLRASALGNPETTQIWLGGGSRSHHTEDIAEPVENDRLYAETVVRESGVVEADNISVEWSEDNTAVDIELSCKVGVLAIYPRPTFVIPASTDPAERFSHLLNS